VLRERLLEIAISIAGGIFVSLILGYLVYEFGFATIRFIGTHSPIYELIAAFVCILIAGIKFRNRRRPPDDMIARLQLWQRLEHAAWFSDDVKLKGAIVREWRAKLKLQRSKYYDPWILLGLAIFFIAYAWSKTG
jgi:hypothetical protein